MKVHLVDGTYELFRAYYGVPPAHDAAGRPVGAVRGLLATLLSLLREPGVTHVACAFDHVIESFRNALFEGYKTGEGIDPDSAPPVPSPSTSADGSAKTGGRESSSPSLPPETWPSGIHTDTC